MTVDKSTDICQQLRFSPLPAGFLSSPVLEENLLVQVTLVIYFLMGRMTFSTHNQQCQSTEGKHVNQLHKTKNR